MTTAENTAQSLITASVTTGSIEHADYSDELSHELLCLSDDSAETDNSVEYWGTTDAGDEWRVHLDRSDPAASGRGYYAVDDGEGNELTTGLGEHEARKVAQRMADDAGKSVYLYEVGSSEEPEEFTPTADSEAACTAVREVLDAVTVTGDAGEITDYAACLCAVVQHRQGSLPSVERVEGLTPAHERVLDSLSGVVSELYERACATGELVI